MLLQPHIARGTGMLAGCLQVQAIHCLSESDRSPGITWYTRKQAELRYSTCECQQYTRIYCSIEMQQSGVGA
jgi:hypothetical protein